MITDFFLLLWVLAITVPIYWAIPARLAGVRLTLISFVSAALLWLLSPIIFLTVLFYGLILAGFMTAYRRGVSPHLLKACSWTVFLPLVAFDHIPAALIVNGILGKAALSMPALVGLSFLGTSYTAIRCFLMVREIIEKRAPSFHEAVATFLYFGSFMAGPICGSTPFHKAAKQLTLEDFFLALSRLGWGSALFLVVKPYINGLDLPTLAHLAKEGAPAAWITMYQRFIVLYVDFSAYSHIAISTALFYGVTLPENFNSPLRSRSIQEFWQRWHLSLSAFISTYLFKPIVREIGKPSHAIFLAFTAVGLWHKVTILYFIWGIGHGAALALNMILRKAIPLGNANRATILAIQCFGWAFTMSYVAFLSSFANAGSWSGALTLITSLF